MAKVEVSIRRYRKLEAALDFLDKKETVAEWLDRKIDKQLKRARQEREWREAAGVV